MPRLRNPRARDIASPSGEFGAPLSGHVSERVRVYPGWTYKDPEFLAWKGPRYQGGVTLPPPPRRCGSMPEPPLPELRGGADKGDIDDALLRPVIVSVERLDHPVRVILRATSESEMEVDVIKNAGERQVRPSPDDSNDPPRPHPLPLQPFRARPPKRG